MKKLLVALVLLALGSSAHAGGLSPEARAYKQGLEDGIKAGMEFYEQYIKTELMGVWDLIDASLNYRYLFLAGEVPPPVVIDKTVVKQAPNGVSYLERKLEFLPPAYFPVDRIEALREVLVGEKVVIPKGWITYVDVSGAELKQIAQWYYLARTDGMDAVFLPSKNYLLLARVGRKADAEGVRSEAVRIGIPEELVKVAQVKEDTFVFVPRHDALADMVRKLAEGLIEKEKKLLDVPAVSPNVGIRGVVYYLQKAYAAVDTISSERHPDFDVVKLREDINAIINEINLYLTERQPYRRLILMTGNHDDERKEPKGKSEDLKKRIERLKRLINGS